MAGSVSTPHQPKVIARACQLCRARKTKCDTKRPSCSSCLAQRRECVYKLQPPRERPTTAALHALQNEKRRLKQILMLLKASSPSDTSKILDRITFSDESDTIHIESPPQEPSIPALEDEPAIITPGDLNKEQDISQENPEPPEEQTLDISPFYSVNEMGHLDSFGPSSALQSSSHPPAPMDYSAADHIRNSLITNAVLERQREYELRFRSDIDGVEIGLAMHLLDLHWSRQHHTYLLTYRPAIMRDLREGGPNCSTFLINALFGCSAKYSRRVEVRDDVDDPKTAGRRFFRRCDELLAKESLLVIPSIPTVIGLILLGSTFNAYGETSKGWLYVGYGLRMIYDLGLHLDIKPTLQNAEEVEIRRRVFWGAFISDKLQSLYLGRPMAIHLRDAHVSRQLMDTLEEKELWKPYVDPMFPDILPETTFESHPFILSVTTFQRLCTLSKIMTQIINKFYVVGATAANAIANLHAIDESLNAWQKELPAELQYDPSVPLEPKACRPPPNLLQLHCLYHSMIILLHRPLLSDGHLRTAAAPGASWRRCSTAARNITNLALVYQASYSLRGGPYILAYALYVACTIHVRNAAALEIHQQGHGENSTLLTASLQCMEDLAVPNPGVIRPVTIIRNLVAKSGLSLGAEGREQRVVEPWDINVDEILRMFPSRTVVGGAGETAEEVYGAQPQVQMRNGGGGSSWQTSGFEQALHEDVLYGFMDGQFAMTYDMGTSLFGMEPM